MKRDCEQDNIRGFYINIEDSLGICICIYCKGKFVKFGMGNIKIVYYQVTVPLSFIVDVICHSGTVIIIKTIGRDCCVTTQKHTENK